MTTKNIAKCTLRLPAPKIENIVLKRKDVSDLGFHSHYREHILIYISSSLRNHKKKHKQS
jgi:hypothetical protein